MAGSIGLGRVKRSGFDIVFLLGNAREKHAPVAGRMGLVGWLKKPLEVGLVQAASTEVKAKKLLGFKTPARSIVSLPMGRASRNHLPETSFVPAKLQKWQRQKEGRFSWYALKSIPPMESSDIILAQKRGGAKENSLAPMKG